MLKIYSTMNDIFNALQLHLEGKRKAYFLFRLFANLLFFPCIALKLYRCAHILHRGCCIYLCSVSCERLCSIFFWP